MISFLLCVLAGPLFAEELSPGDWARFGAADVVILGEVHDNPHHHANQADAVAALKPRALVFEHLTPALADRATPDLVSDADALETALEWESSGWPDFDMYYPIFAAAPEARVLGGGAPRGEVRRAVSEGAAAVFGDGAADFELDRAYTDEVQSSLETLQQEAHCNALPDEMLPGMVEAQRLRDAVLARATLEALNTPGTGPIIVITGNGHASNGWGVPSLLRIQPRDLAVISVGQFEDRAPEAPDFDHWLVTPGVDRNDPCAVFKN